jgi:hypothetical protein
VPALLTAQTYDIVLQRGRVRDPESGLDAVRSVGINTRMGSYRYKATDGVSEQHISNGLLAWEFCY